MFKGWLGDDDDPWQEHIKWFQTVSRFDTLWTGTSNGLMLLMLVMITP